MICSRVDIVWQQGVVGNAKKYNIVMRIERIYEISEILKCLPFEREIRKKGRDSSRESDMILFVKSQLENPMFGFWMAYDNNNNIIGYISAMISLMPGMERLHLLRIYAKQKGLFKQFEDILKEWAKQYKIKIAQMTAKKHIKFFQKKYGYNPVSVNLERRYF